MTGDGPTPMITERLLQDFVDGRLDPQTREGVERVLRVDAGLRARTLEYHALAHRLRAEFAAAADGPPPPPIRAVASRLERRLGHGRRWGLPHGAVAASVLALLLSAAAFGTVWIERHGVTATVPPVASSASLDGERASSDLGQAGGSRATPAVAAAAAGDVPLPEVAPIFAEFGFELVETRTVGDADIATMQLVYESNEKTRVMLYYARAPEGSGGARVTSRREGPLSMLVWQRDGRSFLLFGEIDEETLLAMGRQVEDRLADEGGEAAGEASGTPEGPSGQTPDTEIEGVVPDPLPDPV